MNRVRIGTGIALALAIGMAAVAPAATNELEGKIKGDDDSKVSARVVIEDRAPVRVHDLRFRKVDFDCDGGGMLEGSVDAPDRVPVRKNGNFESKSKDIEIKGEVRLRGRKIVGKLDAELQFDGSRCVAQGSFKAR